MSDSNRNLSSQQFKDLIERARRLARKNEPEVKESLDELKNTFLSEKPISVDLSLLGIDSDSIKTPEGQEDAVDILKEVAGSLPSLPSSPEKVHTTGVAANVTLNEKQQEFISLAMERKDVCFIGAAGTGKTTATGRLIKYLEEAGEIPKLRSGTKWLREGVPGVLITSFTRKAVNNIRRAVPATLQEHVLTMHKILEFAPIFYEVFDEKVNLTKKTMRFEPQRNGLNPLPRDISLVLFEESSMIGVDLYNLFLEALPHRPQEVFIGDIRQLPPIFGPAILGFKMSLLPVIELTEVYRQALLSPIIRLAHAVLSGDATLFSPKLESREEEVQMPDAPKPVKVKRNIAPSLEKFNEVSEHGSVKIQIWQKRLTTTIAMGAITQQFIVWDREGYYNPEDDIILCPFNKEFGTIELNRNIQQYLGKKRGALVHEVVAGFEKHYLAIGDRVLFDKEDAFIVDIKKNLSYSGRPYQHAHVSLDRWGVLQEELTEEEKIAAAKEDRDTSEEAMDKFFESITDTDEDRVNQASHIIDIRFSYDDEVQTLTSAAEVNSLLGGNAITVHKMQGSEAESIFFVLHHSHAGPILCNEMLYTGITRARKKLHIICEPDSLFKGVKSHKVRGITLQDKIDTFKGKVEFKAMQEEMALLMNIKEEKEAIRRREKVWKEEEKEKAFFVANYREKKENEDNLIDYSQLLPSSSFPSIDDVYPVEPIRKETEIRTEETRNTIIPNSLQEKLSFLKRLSRK